MFVNGVKGEIRTHEPVGEWGYGPSALTRLAYPHTLVATKRVALLVVMGLGHLRLLLRHAAIRKILLFYYVGHHFLFYETSSIAAINLRYLPLLPLMK